MYVKYNRTNYVLYIPCMIWKWDYTCILFDIHEVKIKSCMTYLQSNVYFVHVCPIGKFKFKSKK